MPDEIESTSGNTRGPRTASIDVNELERRLQRLVTPENVADARIELVAQQALLSLAHSGDQTRRLHALIALASVKSGSVLGILGGDSQVARDCAVQLPPGLDAALVSSEGVGVPPALIFRDSLRGDPTALENALSQLVSDSSGRLTEDALARRLDELTRVDLISSWTCTWICGLCALAVVDAVPGDEIPVCIACLDCIAITGGQG